MHDRKNDLENIAQRNEGEAKREEDEAGKNKL
jgi:hypothetical protein